MNKYKIILIFLGLAAVYFIVHWFFESKKDAAPSSATLTVTVVHPVEKTLDDILNVTGVTVPRENIIVITELSGVRVVNVLADVGATVKKGQILAELEDESLSHQLDQLKSEYEGAYDEFSRLAKLKDTGYVSKGTLTRKRTVMEAFKARLDDAKLKLSHSKITAPADGIIFERKADIGEIVNFNEALFNIALNGEIEFEANVPEADISKLKVGQTTMVTLTGNETPIQGEIRLVKPSVDTAKRTVLIRITLKQIKSLPIGLFGNAIITLGKIDGFSLPATAIQEDDSGHFVWQLNKGNIASKLPVKIKFRTTDSVLIEPIPANLTVIAKAGAFIKEGEHVNTMETK